MAIERIQAEFSEAAEILDRFRKDPKNTEQVANATDLIKTALRNGNKIISCGNGGSMSDAMHFAEELSGRFREDRPALPAIAISYPTHLSCTANDYGYEYVFSRFIEAMGKEGDVLLAISTSGNSANVLRAIEAAKSRNMPIIGLTGKDGGKMAGMVDIEIRAPHSQYADRAQEIHIKVIHAIIMLVEG